MVRSIVRGMKTRFQNGQERVEKGRSFKEEHHATAESSAWTALGAFLSKILGTLRGPNGGPTGGGAKRPVQDFVTSAV